MVKVKICGVTREADAELVARAGADAVGLNFYPRSPRYVEAAIAERIARALPPAVEAVALFVNEPLARAWGEALRIGARTLQLHGEHRELLPAGSRVVPAFPVRDAASLGVITAYLDLLRAAGEMPVAVLVDAHVPGEYGGTGRRAPWELLADFRPGVPLILAGGLTPENVAEAVRIVRPYAVDVASGVESAPGVKDAEKVRRFIENARAAAG